MKFKKIAVIICHSILEKKKENECGNQITYFWRTCLKSIFQNVNVLVPTMAILNKSRVNQGTVEGEIACLI